MQSLHLKLLDDLKRLVAVGRRLVSIRVRIRRFYFNLRSNSA